MSANMQVIMSSLADLLAGRKVLVVKPRDPERGMEAGLIVSVEDVRGHA